MGVTSRVASRLTGQLTSRVTCDRDGDRNRKGVGAFGNATHGAVEEAGHWRAKQNAEMNTDVTATEFEGQLGVGTPHANNFSGGIEFEDEFMKPADQAGQVTLVRFGEGG
jgi:hypothetical protein